MVGQQSCVVTRSDLMRVSHSGTFENSLNFKIFFTYIGALYVENGYGYELHILWHIPVSPLPVNLKAWECLL